MKPSRGALALLFHLKYLSVLKYGAIKFQRSLAARFQVCTRTIRRWLTELRKCGFLVTIERRGRTSARYIIDLGMSTRMSTQEAENVHSKPPHPLSELNVDNKASETAERKGPIMEQTSNLPERRSLEGFEGFMGVFLAAGKPLNSGDVAAARVIWPLLSFEDRAQAIAAITNQLRHTENPAYMPLPANFLRAKPWTRSAPPRTLPYDKPSKMLDSLEKAWELLKEEGAA